MPRFSQGSSAEGRRTRLHGRRWLGLFGFNLAMLGLWPTPTIRGQTESVLPGSGLPSSASGSSPAANGTHLRGDRDTATPFSLSTGDGSDLPTANDGQATTIPADHLASSRDGLLARMIQSRPFFYLNTGVSYNDNIFVRRDKVEDFVATIEPGVIIALGNYRKALLTLEQTQRLYDVQTNDSTAERFFYLDYHPTFYLFSKNTSEDSVDQSVSLLGGYGFARLTLGGKISYQRLTDDNFDVGNRVERDLYNVDLTSSYQYDDKFSWETNLYGRDREYQAPYESSTEFLNQNYLNCQIGPKTNVSTGFGIGYIDYQLSGDQVYEQFLLRLRRTQFSKLDLSFTGGAELRQNSGTENVADGIFDFSITYRLSENTTFSLSGTRGTEPSAIVNENIAYTRLNLSLQQRLFPRASLILNGAYYNSSYQRVTDERTYARTDNTFALFTGVDIVINSTTTAHFTYQYRNNASTVPVLTYTQNVVGIHFQILF